MKLPNVIITTTITLSVWVIASLAVSSSVTATTGTNKQIPFQGKVVNTNGTNVSDGSYTFVFKIYTVSSGGAAVWTESKSVAVADGVFATMLGDSTSLPGSVDFNTDNIYLGVEFNSDGEMSPRIRFGAVPQAMNALKVAGLTVTDTSGTLTIPNATIAFSGNNNVTFTSSGATNVTLPTTGTLATLAGSETLTNKTIGSTGLVFSGADTDITSAASEGLKILGQTTSSVETAVGMLTLQAAGTSTTSRVQVGEGGSGSTTPDYFGLDVKSTTGDPDNGAEGYMYYNTFDNKFRCYQNSGWTDCIGSGVSATWTSDIDADGYDLADLSNILFRETAGAPTGSDVGLYRDNSGDLNINVLTGKGLNVQVNGTDEYTFTSTAFDAGSNTIQTTGSVLGDSIDRTTGGALALGNSTATSVTMCNSATCDTISIGTNADADTISIGDSLDGLSISSSTFVLNAGAVSGVTTLSLSGDVTWSASTPTFTINSGEGFAISDGSGAFTFDTDTGPTYTSGARPTRQIAISPEYQGASLVGDGSSNTGTMTSDFCEQGVSADIPDRNTSVCNTSGDVHTYYQWTTAEASAQDYEVWVRWRVPDNFSAWAASNPVKVWGKRTDTTNNAITVYVYDTAGTLENASGTQVAGTTWTQTSVEASFGGTYTPGSFLTIRIVMNADTSDSVQVGEITFDYLAKN